MKYRAIAVVLSALFSAITFAQYTTHGIVVDQHSDEPLEGVSVFYDGTTFGTVTNTKGYFEITVDLKMTTPLVVSYIGFETKIFDGSVTGPLGTVTLIEKVTQLEEVVLTPDTWSREKKLNVFRREFLGNTIQALKCTIANEEDIRLYYNAGKNVLYAYAKKPIIIRNGFLGYNVTYHLQDFEVGFKKGTSGLNLVYTTYTAGTAFFSERNERKVKKKYKKNRRETYRGSVLHFMRSLSKKRLMEEGFQIFKESVQVAPYSMFEIKKENGLFSVNQLSQEVSILYDGLEQSMISVKDTPFFIDTYGNHSPPNALCFGGEMGFQRTATLLPLDFSTD